MNKYEVINKELERLHSRIDTDIWATQRIEVLEGYLMDLES